MRILIDTNVLISAILFPRPRMDHLMDLISADHTFVLPSYVMEELDMLFETKFKGKKIFLKRFFSKYAYDYVYTPLDIDPEDYPEIRDKDDLPILVSAIVAGVDVIITGDKDFFDIKVKDYEKGLPIIVTPNWRGLDMDNSGSKEVEIKLSDGRKISVGIYGESDCNPIIFLHGFGASKSCIHPDYNILKKNKVYIISIDRPGFGKSDIKKGYSAYDFAKDVNEVIDYFKLNKVAILGWSAGGLYGQVFATLFPEKVSVLSLVSSAIPINNRETSDILPGNWKLIKFMNNNLPLLSRLFFKIQYQSIKKDFHKAMEKSVEKMDESERIVLDDPGIKNMMIKATREAFVNKELGLYYDAIALCKPISINHDNEFYNVRIWQGTKDKIWTQKTSEHLHQKFVKSVLKSVNGEGHLLIFSHWEEIISSISLPNLKATQVNTSENRLGIPYEI